MTEPITLNRARANLSAIWFIGSAAIFVVMVAQTFGGIYGPVLEKAWGWVFPNLLPTLGIIAGVNLSPAASLNPRSEEDQQHEAHVSRITYLIAFFISLFYLLNVLVVIFIAPTVSSADTNLGDKPMEVLKTSSYWLVPLQGLVSTALASLFMTKSERPNL
jgi:hypothetical protein